MSERASRGKSTSRAAAEQSRDCSDELQIAAVRSSTKERSTQVIGGEVGPQAGFTRLAVRRNGGRRSGIPTPGRATPHSVEWAYVMASVNVGILDVGGGGAFAYDSRVR